MENYEEGLIKPVKNEFQRRYFGVINGKHIKPVLLNPIFIEIFGSMNSALFLSQMLYWQGKGRNPDWVYKTIVEMKQETGLTRRKQDNAISILINMDVLSKKLTRSIPPKRTFKVNMEKLDKLFVEHLKNYEK